MKVCFVLVACLVAVSLAAEDEFCYNDAVAGCSTSKSTELAHCNARFGGITQGTVMTDLFSYVNTHIERSFQYLLMSTHFGNFEKNRAGFEKKFRGLSDSAWEDAIDIIKYVTKRGGTMDFGQRKETQSVDSKDITYELYELSSLAKAVDIQKSLAQEAHKIHSTVSLQDSTLTYDPETASYLENHFLHKHSESIRELSGHTNDLKNMLSNHKQTSLAVFLFDEFLQK